MSRWKEYKVDDEVLIIRNSLYYSREEEEIVGKVTKVGRKYIWIKIPNKKEDLKFETNLIVRTWESSGYTLFKSKEEYKYFENLQKRRVELSELIKTCSKELLLDIDEVVKNYKK